ncbi:MULTISPECIES: hypothetical protein [Rhodococcus]|uniref:Allantoicase n=1 Tax=Rhodococcus wratislaviensis TaxID=44752 RepID=A0AB38FM02_RHOWR|nr:MULTISPECIES: hypothetical protein [Rhodococcus]WAM17740.1 hypothetical protein OYT95_14325 [Rhodococcus sp. JS3073]SPZ42632.1 allantoicase [Rhodococcus wratislaviensis]
MTPNTLTAPSFHSPPPGEASVRERDGGTARLRLWGSLTAAGRAGLES